MRRKAKLKKTPDPTIRCCYCGKMGPCAGFLVPEGPDGHLFRTPDLCYRCMDQIVAQRRAISAADPSKETLIVEFPEEPPR